MGEFISLPINLAPEACPLCLGLRTSSCDVAGRFFKCADCTLHFLHSSLRLPPSQEQARYETHNNDVNDPGYQQFLEPLFSAIAARTPAATHGLDFGAGPGPALAEMFTRHGYKMSLYDPFFWRSPEKLNQIYDFIVTSEVVEHLYAPHTEFQRLFALLKPGAWLGIMTLVLKPPIDFETWYYRRDPTHVVFFTPQTFVWIQSQLGFEQLTFIGDRIVLLRKPNST